MCRYVLCGVSVYFLDKHGQKGILHVCDTVCEGGGWSVKSWNGMYVYQCGG